MRKGKLCILALMVLLIHRDGLSMNEMKGSGQGKGGITEQQARSLIYQFLKREGVPNTREDIESHLEMTGIREHPNLGELYTYDGEMGEFWVSRGRGTVVKYNAPAAFTITEAEEFSREFVLRHIPDFGSRNFRLENSEADGQFWREEWREYRSGEKEVSIFPNWISVTVNLERRSIHNFSFSDLRRIRYNQPAISEEKVRVMIMERFPEGKILELELIEHTADGGRTWVTIWNALVNPSAEEEVPAEIISIDADTGRDVPL